MAIYWKIVRTAQAQNVAWLTVFFLLLDISHQIYAKAIYKLAFFYSARNAWEQHLISFVSFFLLTQVEIKSLRWLWDWPQAYYRSQQALTFWPLMVIVLKARQGKVIDRRNTNPCIECTTQARRRELKVRGFESRCRQRFFSHKISDKDLFQMDWGFQSKEALTPKTYQASGWLFTY